MRKLVLLGLVLVAVALGNTRIHAGIIDDAIRQLLVIDAARKYGLGALGDLTPDEFWVFYTRVETSKTLRTALCEIKKRDKRIYIFVVRPTNIYLEGRAANTNGRGDIFINVEATDDAIASALLGSQVINECRPDEN